MMNWLIFVTLAFGGWTTVYADPNAQLYLNPYYPQYTEQEQAPLLEASVQRDFIQFAERRDRLQSHWYVGETLQDQGLLQRDRFVLRRILDRSSARFLKSAYFRKTGLGRSANQLKDKMETQVEFADSKNQNHKFDFKMALFQGQIFFQYQGFTKAQLRYDFSRGGQTALILQQDLGPFSAIGIETSLAGSQTVQMVTLTHNW